MPKNYHNPIAKPATVTLTKWEYAQLVECKTILATLRLMVENDRGYDAVALMKMMIENEKKEVEK